MLYVLDDDAVSGAVMTPTLTRLRQLVAFDEREVISVKHREWPLQRHGAMIVESLCEDGTWSAYAESGPGKGNLKWETESIPVAVLREGEVIMPKPAIEALIKVAEAANASSENWINIFDHIKTNERGEVVEVEDEWINPLREALRGLEEIGEEKK